MKKNNNLTKKTEKIIGKKNTETIKKLILFGLGGILLLTTKLILTYALTDILRINITISYLITIIIATIIGFLYSYYVTFKNKTEPLKKFTKYTASIGIFYAADYVAVLILTKTLGIYHLVSIIIVTTIIFFLKFIVYDKLIFKEKNQN